MIFWSAELWYKAAALRTRDQIPPRWLFTPFPRQKWSALNLFCFHLTYWDIITLCWLKMHSFNTLARRWLIVRRKSQSMGSPCQLMSESAVCIAWLWFMSRSARWSELIHCVRVYIWGQGLRSSPEPLGCRGLDVTQWLVFRKPCTTEDGAGTRALVSCWSETQCRMDCRMFIQEWSCTNFNCDGEIIRIRSEPSLYS